MSWQDVDTPVCAEQADELEMLITSRSKDLGGFSVRRVLPASDRSSVGPFVFFDEMGPADFAPGEGIDVRPHPHIGLATLTYLFEGEILHRDSLGYEQAIRPGAVNLMTAGRGIVHSERTSAERREQGQRLHGIQSWMALPDDLAETEPSFVHHPADTLPVIEQDGARITLVAGTAFGARSPVQTASPTLYLDIVMDAGACIGLPKASERALYVIRGDVSLGACALPAGCMGVLTPGSANLLRARDAARVILVGGDGVGPRELWWNFVARSPARLDEARQDWREGRFPEIEGDDEFIPLPDG